MVHSMAKNILFRAVIEVIGKPQEHVEKSIREYIQGLKENARYEVVQTEFADLKKQKDQELWATFAELEVKTEKIEDLTNFCFDYMPSIIEIIEPKEFILTEGDLSQALNDLQAKLHQVDLIAKHAKLTADEANRSVALLLKNYVLVLLSRGNLAAEALSKLTGVTQDKLEDFLDQLIDERKIDLKEGIYFLKKEEKTVTHGN